MNNKIRDILLTSMLLGTHEYAPFCLDMHDEMVTDCLMNMYFYMLSSDMDEKVHEKYWRIFDDSYQKLNKEQQEIVKNDYIEIINAQNKYENEKIKVKKKGMINYE